VCSERGSTNGRIPITSYLTGYATSKRSNKWIPLRENTQKGKGGGPLTREGAKLGGDISGIMRCRDSEEVLGERDFEE